MASSQEDLIYQNFANPKGKLGYWAGEQMAQDNYDLNKWAIKLLEIQPTDNILEIGYGPGLAIRDIALLATEGHVSGLDLSELMFRQAQKINQTEIHNGRVDLKCGDICLNPMFSRKFDKIISINSIMYWSQPINGLKNLTKHLKPGGTISIVMQRPENMFKQGKCDADIDLIIEWLKAADFTNIAVAATPIEIRKKNQKTQNMSGISIRGFYDLFIPAITNSQDYLDLITEKTIADSLIVRHRATLTHLRNDPV